MSKIARLFALSLLLVLTYNTQAQQLTSFNDMMDALKTGKNVAAVMQYAKFKMISDNEEQDKVPDAIGGMDLSTWEYFAPNAVKNKEAFVVFSETKLIQNPKGDGFVYNYVKLRIEASTKVKITARYVDPRTFEVKMDENFFGNINDGKNEGGLLLFIK
jgi:hypothetical protein